MNINNLKLIHYKGYKELTTILDTESKGGKSKMLQLKDWKRYFDWIEHSSYDWEVTVIYEVPMDKEDGRKHNGSESKYSDYIDDLILMMLKQYTFEGRRKNFFYEALKMFNIESYYDYQNDVKEYSEANDTPLWIYDDFFGRVGSFMSSILKGSLNRLVTKGAIEVIKMMKCKDITDEDKEPRELILFEIEQYESILTSVGDEFGINGKYVPPSISPAYWGKVREETLRLMDLNSIWTEFQIYESDNYDDVAGHIPSRNMNLELWISSYYDNKVNLNKAICDCIINNAKKRIQTAIDLKDNYEKNKHDFGLGEEIEKKKAKYERNRRKYNDLIEHQKLYIEVFEELTNDLIKTHDIADIDFYGYEKAEKYKIDDDIHIPSVTLGKYDDNDPFEEYAYPF
ncbi:hypothetical protein M3194_15700 [Paenibacillus glycanilyticus]|uniref:hypothetical protein n=1 Tax=Paenibacillus glycanilyticus TaxID=126569 RepID=UPI00203FBD86|nr:hypothetical protein [Paenibacillus glycanilyticus]MCM3628788.1 hypothetical protein [Paenibacillus glycanilyticus]